MLKASEVLPYLRQHKIELGARRWRAMRESGEFPAPIAKTGRVLLWRESTIDAWIAKTLDIQKPQTDLFTD